MNCKAPDCENDREFPHGRFCSMVCANVAIQVAAERLDTKPITEPVPDKRVAEIREETVRSFEAMREQFGEHD